MRFCARRSLWITIVTVLACGGSAADSARDHLTRLVVTPDKLPKACSLRWNSPPATLLPDGDSRALLETSLAFWFGEAAPKPSDIEVGVFNVYGPQWGDPSEDRLVILTLAFDSKDKAGSAGEALESRYQGSPARIRRNGRYLALLIARPSVDPQCSDALWKQLEREL